MPIELRCECGAGYRVPDNTRGRKVRCKHCQALIPVPLEEVVAEVPVEVIEEEEPVEVMVEERESAAEAEERRRRKKEKKRKRRDKTWAPTLEERLALRDGGHSGRRGERRRGWMYLGSGLGLITVGAMMTVATAMLANADPQNIGKDYGVLSLSYRIAGIWTWLIGFGIAGLIPCTLGVLNFMGIAIVVEEPDD